MSQEASAVAWWREPSRGQWMSFLAAWLGWVLDAFDFTIFLLVMPQLTHEFGVSYVATAGSITLTLLVRLLGGMGAGWAADRWGRRLPLIISVIWFALCDGAIAFAPSFAWILILRTLFGFGMGAEWTSGATLAMENWPARSRGIASGILQGSWAVGYLLAGVAFGFVVPAFGWRALFLIAAAPALLALPIRIWVPESPEWLARAKDQQARRNAPDSLPRREFAKRIAWASLVMALAFGGYYALTALYPTMLIKEAGLSPTAAASLVALFNVGMLVGAPICGLLASRKGVIVAVVLPVLFLLPALPMYVGWMGSLGLGALLAGMFGAGISGVSPLLLTSLFPAELRARSVGFVYHFGAAGGALVPPAVAMLVERAGLTFAQSIALFSGGLMGAMGLCLVVAMRTGFAGSTAPAASAATTHTLVASPSSQS